MQKIAEMMTARAAALLADGTVQRVLGWKKGDFDYDLTPAFFETADELKDLVYGDYSGANLSKYLIKAGKKEGKTLVFLKPCDTLSMNQLMAEHRVDREKVYVIGVGCKGMLDHEKVEAAEAKGEKKERLELMLGKCQDCKGKTFAVSDEVIDDEESRVEFGGNRFSKVAELEAMTCDERFAFWQSQLQMPSFKLVLDASEGSLLPGYVHGVNEYYAPCYLPSAIQAGLPEGLGQKDYIEVRPTGLCERGILVEPL